MSFPVAFSSTAQDPNRTEWIPLSRMQGGKTQNSPTPPTLFERIYIPSGSQLPKQDLTGAIGFIVDKEFQHGLTHRIIGSAQSVFGGDDTDPSLMHAFTVIGTDDSGKKLRIAEATEKGITSLHFDPENVRGGDGLLLFVPQNKTVAHRVARLSDLYAVEVDESSGELKKGKTVAKYAFADLVASAVVSAPNHERNYRRIADGAAKLVGGRRLEGNMGEPESMICSAFAATMYQVAAVATALLEQDPDFIENIDFQTSGMYIDQRDAEVSDAVFSLLSLKNSPLHKFYHSDAICQSDGQFVMPCQLEAALRKQTG